MTALDTDALVQRALTVSNLLPEERAAISTLAERVEQLERQLAAGPPRAADTIRAAKAEARVAELEREKSSLEARLRALGYNVIEILAHDAPAHEEEAP